MQISLNTGQGVNNSPEFISPPISYLIVNNSCKMQQQAFDADGDSLVYSIVPCLQGANQNVSYLPGYSPNAPLGTTWNVSINPQTGECSFIAGNYVLAVMAIKVEEYRNGVFIGSISRDMQVAVVNNSPNAYPDVYISNISGGTYHPNPNNFGVFPNSTLFFDITFLDADVNDSLSFTSNILNAFPNATLTANSNINPLVLHFSWTPALSDTGKYEGLIIHAKDNHCDIRGDNYLLCNIKVEDYLISANISTSSCSAPTGAIDITVNGGQPPYTFSWNTGATTEDLSNIPIGMYWVTVADASTNVWHSDTFYVNSANMSATYNFIAPTCYQNTGGIEVSVSGGQAPYFYTWSNGQTGAIINNLPIGGYSVTAYDALGCMFHDAVLLTYSLADSCFSTISGKVYFDINQNCIQDLGEPNIPNVYAYIYQAPYYLGMLTDSSGSYSFMVQDTGNYPLMIYSTSISPTISACAPTPLNKNIYMNAFGIDSMHNDFPVNVLPDISASIWSLPPIPNTTYSSYIQCNNYTNYLINTATLTYQHDSLILNPVFSPAPNNYDPLTRTATWNLQNFTAGKHPYFTIIGTTSSATNLGDTIKCQVSITPVVGDSFPQNNQHTLKKIAVASYDPNFKEVEPKGETLYGFIPPNTSQLEYVVHFQNTGNYPAEYVIIKDTIEANKVNLTSIQLLLSSHNCIVETQQDSILIFTFANINLPDSTSDEPNSHGFVKYSLQLLPNLQLNTQIRNSASIYFDFNAPVLTNTVLNTIYKPMQVSVTADSNLCPSNSVTANIQFGKPPYHLEWSNGTQNWGNMTGICSTPANFTSGAQSVQITDGFGQTTQQTFYLDIQAIADAGFSVNNVGNNYVFTPNSMQNATYFWSFGNGQNSISQTPLFTFTQSGVYNVKLMVTDSCMRIDSSSQTIYVTLTDIDAAFALGAKLSPNPFDATSTLRFENPEDEVYELIIRDISGKIVQKIEHIRANEVKIERGSKAKGIYMWELKGEKQAQGLMVIE
jgi:hypothetical protein